MIVFLYVGADPTLPEILVRSIRQRSPGVTVIHCADETTPAVAGVDRVARFAGDAAQLMTFRLSCFAELALQEPALYIDADMACLKPLDASATLGGAEVAVCRREYELRVRLNPVVRGIDLSKYAGQTIGEAWPYVACCTATLNAGFWQACLKNLTTLEPQYGVWFGDQEAIRNVVRTGQYNVRYLPETVYAHQPGVTHATPKAAPRLAHFKGVNGKRFMLEWAEHQGLAR